MVLNDDAPREAAAEAVRVGGEARPQLVLLLAEYVWRENLNLLSIDYAEKLFLISNYTNTGWPAWTIFC